MHRNTEHRHIHFVFFERRGTHKRKGQKILGYSRGKIEPEAFAEFKLNMESYLTDTWRQVVMARDKLITGVDDKERIKNLHLGMVQKEIMKLARLLPKEGRLAYNSDNMKPLRPLIDSITESIIYADPFAKEWYWKLLSAAEKRYDETRNHCKHYGLDPEPRMLTDKTKADFFARTGNKVIGFAKECRNGFDDITAPGGKKMRLTPDKHIITENTHEPLISREDFNRVQDLMKARHRPSRHCAEVVLNIYREYAAGKIVKDIINDLTEKGIMY